MIEHDALSGEVKRVQHETKTDRTDAVARDMKTPQDNDGDDFHHDGNVRKYPLSGWFSGSRNSFGSWLQPVEDAPRLVKRDLKYHQSSSKFNIRNIHGDNKWTMITIFSGDWFHIILRQHTILSVGLMMGAWVTFIIFFAVIYMYIDKQDERVKCGLGFDDVPIQFHGAFAFSLETCTTVGYGLPGDQFSFFENCPGLQTAIFFQMMFSMLFNACLLAVVFARISRAEARALQFLFTDKACIRRESNGQFTFEFKVYDHDSKYPIIGAQIQLYAVHCSSSRNYIPMRTFQPDDAFKPPLLPSIPTTIIHHIDAYSPLLPPSFRKKNNVIPSMGLNMREIDSHTGSADIIPCPICGCMFGTYDRLKCHIIYSRITEEHDEYQVEGTHQELTEEEIDTLTTSPLSDRSLSLQAMKNFWEDSKMEVVVVVIGTDPLTSGSFQAMHSYNCENIVYGRSFKSDCTHDNKVNLGQFHETYPFGSD